jgi:hypothetical protein
MLHKITIIKLKYKIIKRRLIQILIQIYKQDK